jgi:hypothetical protein
LFNFKSLTLLSRVQIWREIDQLYRQISSNLYAVDFVKFIYHPLRKDKVLLHEKYVKEGLSIGQISEQIFSSKEAVRIGLIDAGIELRPKSLPHNRPSHNLENQNCLWRLTRQVAEIM